MVEEAKEPTLADLQILLAIPEVREYSQYWGHRLALDMGGDERVAAALVAYLVALGFRNMDAAPVSYSERTPTRGLQQTGFWPAAKNLGEQFLAPLGIGGPQTWERVMGTAAAAINYGLTLTARPRLVIRG